MIDFLIPAVIIVILIAINGLFVAAEFAIAGVSRPAMERRANEGSRVARSVSNMLADPRKQDQYIATAQLGITFASLGLGMYGEHQLAVGLYNYFDGSGWGAWLASHALATVLAITILTYFHIVVGEMVPKALALQQPEKTALWITPPMLWIKKLAIVLVIGLNGIGNGTLRLFGIRRTVGSEQLYTANELRFVVQESAEGGQLKQAAAEVLQELFEFGDLNAGDVMVPRVNVRGIPLGATNEEIEAVVRESRHTRYPVFERDLDHIVGMVHIKDLLRRLVSDEALTVDHVRQVPFVPESSPVDKVLDIMRTSRTQLVVVLDEHGGTAGIVTMGELFEEIVGGIHEGIARKPDLFIDEAGRLHAAGIVRLDELGEHFGIEIEHEEVDTVSGLVLALLNRPPRLADVVQYETVRLQVTALAGRGVAECVVTVEEREESQEN